MQQQKNTIEQATRIISREHFVFSQLSTMIVGHSIPSQGIAQQILKAINPAKTKRLLVVGSGAGYIPALCSVFSERVVAVDKVSALAESAKRRLSALGIENVQVLAGDGARLNYEQGPFDTIVICTPRVGDKTLLLNQLSHAGELISFENTKNGLIMLTKTCKEGENHFEHKDVCLLDFSTSKNDILIEVGLVSNELLQIAKVNARQKKTLLIDELRKLIPVDDIELYRSLALKNKIELGNVDLLLQKAQPGFFESCSRAFLDHNHLIPVYAEGKKLFIVSNDPDSSLKDIQLMFPAYQLEKLLVTPTDFHRLWSTLDLSIESKKKHVEISGSDKPNAEQDLLEKPQMVIDAHLIALFEAMLLDAVGERASDIHLEQYGNRVRVRLRIDGELVDLQHYKLKVTELKGLINVIKLRAELNIAEKRLPQGGRSRLKVGGALYNLRIQVQPALYGEHVIIRLLPESNANISIEKLGFSDKSAAQYRRFLDNPQGLLLVVGPTGCGKSTTLYAGLQVLAADGSRKVITIEDPIEYSIDNIQQARVRPEIGFNFADAMRSFVRQDPDVIFVGEIRDEETALEAVRASQTGHLVLSTLHCNDSVDSLQRIYDLGIHPNSIASELLAVIAQRLAKKICNNCKQEAIPETAIVAELFPEGVPKDFRCFKGAGCVHCEGQGTRGRVAIAEFFHIKPDTRIAISKQPPIAELRRLALENGLLTMRDSALEHVMAGNIPLSELPRILPEERMAPESRSPTKEDKDILHHRQSSISA